MKKPTLHETKLRDFRGCKLRYYRATVLGMRVRLPLSPMLIGSVFHRSLELFYKRKNRKKIIESIPRQFEKAVKQTGLSNFELERLALDEVTTTSMVKGYFKHRLSDLKNWNIMGVEYPLRYDYGDFFYEGKMDLVISDEKGGIWGVETKTATQVDHMYMARLTIDFQVTAYLKHCEMAGVKPKGMIYNIMKKPQIKPRQGETLEAYGKRLTNDIIKVRPEFYFPKRVKLTRSRFNLKEYERQLVMLFRDLRFIDKHKLWYKNDAMCFHMGKCQYLSLCRDGLNKQTLSFYEIGNKDAEIL